MLSFSPVQGGPLPTVVSSEFVCDPATNIAKEHRELKGPLATCISHVLGGS